VATESSKTTPLRSVRGTAAGSLLAEVAAAPESRFLTGISGLAGSGKSALLDDLEAHYRSVGVPVHRDHDGLRPDLSTGRGAVLVDDAHQLGDNALTRIHSLVDERDVDVVVTYGLWPQPPALQRLVAALEQHHPEVVLGPFSRTEIATAAEASLRRPVPTKFVDQVAESTGGVPWLVHLVLNNAAGGGGHALSGQLNSRGVMSQLGYELDTAHHELRELLLALAVGFDLSGRLPAHLESSGDHLDELVTRAQASGLVLPHGRLVPLVQQALLETTPPYRVRSLQRALVDTVVAEGRPLEDVAESLSRAGLRDQRVATTLERAGDGALDRQPATALTLYDQARAAGSNELSTAARRAQAAFALGDLDQAAQILDRLLTHEDAPDLIRAVDVAAAVWAQRGMLQRSAEMYRWLGPDRVGPSAVQAAVAMFGVGDREGADAMLAAAPGNGSPTLLSVAVSLMGEGLRDSVNGPAGGALPALIRASDMMTAAGVIAPLPDLPAALAALVALHSGELTVADSILDRALAGGQGGAAARPRLQLLRAWVAMLADQTELAHAATQQATGNGRDLAPRDELLLRALEVGLARRADDAPALVRGWQRARESILHVPIDLYSLMPLGELVVSATRLRDSAWLQEPLAEAWALLDRLGNPPLWSVPLHWSSVQSAILSDRPAELAPHAAALVRASSQSRLASVLAAAGRAWVAVRAGQFGVAAVEDAARGLASVGLTWDGSRLAGHAAARTEERKDMARLLACARSLRPGSIAPAKAASDSQSRSTDSVAPADARVGTIRDATGLSAREREVARLVLEGNTYEEIGEAIFISPRTVEHHVARIRRQLGAATRSQLLAQLRLVLGDAGESTE
jgi:DNA-binding CsgD family transcriptional regulator/tetratricopeptide (TPR) repeat protein